MKDMTTEAFYYTGFEYSATELNKYVQAAGIFTILLANNKVVHFFPEDQEHFKQWLDMHGVPNIRN